MVSVDLLNKAVIETGTNIVTSWWGVLQGKDKPLEGLLGLDTLESPLWSRCFDTVGKFIVI